MQFEIHRTVTTKELIPVSYILGSDRDQPNGIKMAHCCRCGEKLAQHQGRIVAIYPGLVPAMRFPVYIRCGNCGENFAIGSISQ